MSEEDVLERKSTFKLTVPRQFSPDESSDGSKSIDVFQSCRKGGWMRYLPIVYWLPKYRWKEYLWKDILSGFTAGVMLIPQGMAYALIAGLEPIIGLYSSMFGPLLYCVFGTSGQLSVAPVAIVSLMTGEAIESQLHASDSDEFDTEKYLSLASCLALQVGVVQTILGLLKAGILANMLSHSVIVGFTGAAAFIIGIHV